MLVLTINGQRHEIDADANTPLLWALREQAGLVGTKFGCGISQCGACTVHLDGAPIRSCVTPLAVAECRHVTTIEGVAKNGKLHPVQQAWIDEQVPQCGYCQSGQIMSAIALLATNPISGLTAALYGDISIQNGAVQQSNFHDYRMVRMHDAPEIETHIINSGNSIGGAGEPGTPAIAPAL